MRVFIIGMAVITILSLAVIVYSLAVIASKTDRLMAMINDERSVENEDNQAIKWIKEKEMCWYER